MKISESIECPKCKGKEFSIKHESTYLYTYKINTPEVTNSSKENEFLPFLFDNREHVSLKQYIYCEKCKSKFPCSFDVGDEKINLTIIQKAIRSDYIQDVEFDE